MALRTVLVALILSFLPALSWAKDSCSCQNLESLQQEVENAVYEADFYQSLSDRLAEIERKQIELNGNPANASDPNYGLLVHQVSSAARAGIVRDEFRLPHGRVTGYTGPDAVDMEIGECRQDAKLLKEMDEGSPCQEIADIALKHEEQHRQLCQSMGKDAYWTRLPSLIAAEEAERYREQRDAMRNQLKRVIDEGTITVDALMEPRVSGPQFDVTYSYATAKSELQGKSASGAESWTLNGKTTRKTTITRAQIAGMNCTSSGQLNDSVEFKMETDGLSASLHETTRGTPGDIQVKCKGGIGMSMRPDAEGGTGPVFEALQLRNEMVEEIDIRDMEFGKVIAAGGVSVSGMNRTTVTLVCPGN